MSIHPAYAVEPVLKDGDLADVRISVAGKTWHLCGRSGAAAEERPAGEALASGGLPVLFGSGLGRALDLLLERTAPVAVVDKESPILEVTGLRRRFAGRPGVVWLDDSDPEKTAAALADLSRQAGGRPLAPVVLPLYLRLDPAYYKTVRALIEGASAAAGPSPTTSPSSPRRTFSSPPRVLLVTSKLFLLGEIVRVCERLGAPHRYLDVGGDEADLDEFVSRVSRTVREFRPDFLLTMNHLGVDREGVLLGLLERLGLPLASWFLDNPELMLFQYARPANDLTAIFTWDADNLGPLRQKGFPHVFYLPLATDESRFKPLSRIPKRHPWKARVSFVGNSMLLKARARFAKADPPPPLMARAAEVAAAFGQDPERSVQTFLRERFPELAPYHQAMPDEERRMAFEAGLVWESTRQYRAECLGRLMPFRPLIVGDPGWLETFSGEGKLWRRLSEMTYYDDLPRFYPLTEVNFNVTSRQMKGAVNQRVFDVPACGAFLLTDYRAQMEDLFDLGREVVAYSHPDEIPDLVRHYLAHPGERRAIVRAGREKVLARHTYMIRTAELFAVMKQTFSG